MGFTGCFWGVAMKRISQRNQNTAAFQLRENAAREMPQNAALRFFSCFLLAFLCNVGLVFGVAGALGVLVHPPVVFYFILFFTFLFCALHFLPRLRWAGWLMCLLFYLVLLKGAWEFFSQGFILTTNVLFQNLSLHGAGKLPQYVVTLAAQDWESARLTFLLFLIFLFNALITIGVCEKNFFLVFFTSLLLFTPAMVYAITPPLWCLALLAAAIGAVAVAGSAPKQIKGHTPKAMLRNGICISLAALICFSGICVSYSPAFLRGGSLRGLRQAFGRLSFLYDSESSGTADPVGSSTTAILSGGGPIFTGKTILRMKTNASHNLYLKSQSLGVYKGNRWETNNFSIKQDNFNAQLFTSLYLGFLNEVSDSREVSLPPLDKSLKDFTSSIYSVEVEPVADDIKTLYLPYGFIEKPWDAISAAYFMGDTAAPFLSGQQKNYSFTAYDVDLSMLKNSPYWTERNLIGRSDQKLEGTRSFRRNNLRDYFSTYCGSEAGLNDDIRHFLYEESSYRQSMYDFYTSVPADLRTKLNDLLEESCPSLFDGQISYENTGERIYRAALQIRSLLNSRCSYNSSIDPLPAETDNTEYFLFESREGYCIHFATAAVMLFRTLGIPARYAEGYLVQNEQGENGWISVPDESGHAWAEVYAPGFGWIPVETTPSEGLQVEKTEPAATTDPTASTTAPDTSTPENTTEPATKPDGSPITERGASGWGLSLPVRIALFTLLGILSLVLLVWFRFTYSKRSREKRFHQLDRSKAVIAIYEYLQQLEAYAEIPQEALELAEKAAFSQHSVTPEEQKQMLRFADEAAQKTAEKLSPLRKFWMRFFLNLI